MPTTIKRQLIMDAIEARMQTIRTSNGYYTELGTHVFVWPMRPIQEAELPALVLRDERNEPFDELNRGAGGNRIENYLHIKFEVLTSGPTSITVVRQMLADVNKAFGGRASAGEDDKYGGLVNRILIDGDAMEVEQQEKKVAGIVGDVRAWYTTTKFKES